MKIKMACQHIVKSDFFGVEEDVVIYEFGDGTCIVIGTHTVPCPTVNTNSLDEAKKVAETIYYSKR